MKLTIIPVIALAALIACAPVISQRGYLPDPSAEGGIRPGADTKTSVQERLGYASTTATFGNDGWYYISATEKQVAFFRPTVLRRQVLAVYFDKENKVVDVRHYGLSDGHLISFETKETPARGRETTFLQELLKATPSAGVSSPIVLRKQGSVIPGLPSLAQTPKSRAEQVIPLCLFVRTRRGSTLCKASHLWAKSDR
jgi:outer membrane protein assembly factor BamE (lipoprotein component of BamABCDE complex)